MNAIVLRRNRSGSRFSLCRCFDKRDTGVVVTNSRSKVIDNILDLLHEGAITLDDLSDFSEELQEKIKFIYSGGYNNPDNCNRL